MATTQTAQQVIDALGLSPHPEGGFYKETFRDPALIIDRSVSTLIYFLLETGNFSTFHRLDASEGWHYYAGTGAIEIIELDTKGPKITTLGADFTKGQTPQYVVGKGNWFAARVAQSTSPVWALVGNSVAPAFEFSNFEIGNRTTLLQQFPNCSDVITALTPTPAS